MEMSSSSLNDYFIKDESDLKHLKELAGNGTSWYCYDPSIVLSTIYSLMLWIRTNIKHSQHINEKQYASDIIRDGEAWCDGSARCLIALCYAVLGCSGRRVQLIHKDGVQGHSVCEIKIAEISNERDKSIIYSDGWILFDQDYLNVFEENGHLLSALECCQKPHIIEQQYNRGTGCVLKVMGLDYPSYFSDIGIFEKQEWNFAILSKVGLDEFKRKFY